ncbi:unnamed protein product [Adineta steineri]|uniref:non-specific serine/threonine protein kinase n=1 Tax=Adineta steineri TaxID=433720 RepID=A0A814TVK8_9BILA|nr:unnamed protein product [Adineta steineri]CAF1571518.1 unnamed protein product [Adineta steineri]
MLGTQQSTGMIDITKEPISSFIANNYRTAEIIAYMKSLCDDTKIYNKMRLMLLGNEQTGKTSLLQAFKRESSNVNNAQQNQRKKSTTTRNFPILDISEWIYDKTPRTSLGPVTFRIWDFGGEHEFQSVYQYFFTRRTLYIICWKMTEYDMNEQIFETIHNILINIQTVAPGSSVIIVGTHHDQIVKLKNYRQLSENFQSLIYQKFIDTSQNEKLGYPKVLDSLEISNKTGHNIKQLCTLIHDIAGQLLVPNSKDQTIFQQRIPAKYIYLEELLEEYRLNKKISILNDKEYQELIKEISQRINHVQFRDSADIQQATKWLHENGIIIHFEDTLLSNYYFLDPQYLAELLAQLVANEQTNGLSRHGLMKIDELPITFQDANTSVVNSICMLLPLLQKFDLAITWDNQHVIFPSLLPVQLSLNTISSHCRASIISTSSVIQFKQTSNQHETLNILPAENSSPSTSLHLKYLARIKKDDDNNQSFSYIRRFYHLIFIPTCFWSRLFTRLIGDKQLQKAFTNYFLVDLQLNNSNEKIKNILLAECSWIVCQTGLELRYYDCCLLRINQINLTSSTIDDDISYSYLNMIFQFDTDEEQKKQILPFNDQGSLIEILICTSDLQMVIDDNKDSNPYVIELIVQQNTIAHILTILMAHFDTLLEDWYPEMGTRFVQNSKGDYLVNRFIPCHQCLIENNSPEKFLCHTFWLEALMMLIEKKMEVKCEKHGEISLEAIAPDLIFLDLSMNNFLISFEAIKLKKLLGQGTFGTVFATTSYKSGLDLACKTFVPIDPSITSGLMDQIHSGNKDDESEKKLSLRDIAKEWIRNPIRAASKAYITCRQELSCLLTTGSHPNIVPLIGLCTHPLSLILHYAPMGSLESILKEYKRTNTQLGLTVYQKLITQVANAIAHLHTNHIIYLDLKSENILVWNMPQPRLPSNGQVLVKLSDFSISRVLSPIGTKGFAGTEGYIAPEIVRFTGDELYTEKADIFSFSMLMYECLSLNHPFSRNKRDHARELILHGWRPSLTEQELSSPTLILDLMVACWSEHPNDRPSAKDIHQLSSSLEFRHLMDVIEIGSREEFNDSNTLAAVSYREINDNYENDNNDEDDDDIGIPTADCWFVRQSKQNEQSSIVIVAYDQFNAVNQQIINLGNCEIRCIYYHQRDHVILLADNHNLISIYCTRTFQKLNHFLLVHHQENGHAVHMTSLPETSIVFLLLSDNSIYSIDLPILLHRNRNSMSTITDLCYRYVANVSLPTFKILALPTASGRNVEIWCGCSLGNLRIIDVRTAQLSVQLSHHLASGSSAVHLLCASKDSPYQYLIWTAMKTGSFVCVWNHLSRRMTNQLDCGQILKRKKGYQFFLVYVKSQYFCILLGDSNDLTIDSILSTRLLVFIGLNTGHIIIVKSSSIQVLYTVHAYDQHVLHLFALSPSAFLPSTTTGLHDGRFITQFKFLQEKFEQHRIHRENSRTPLLARSDNNDTDLDNISYMLAIGYGAKACQSIPQLQQHSSDAIFLQTWSLDDFIL